MKFKKMFAKTVSWVLLIIERKLVFVQSYQDRKYMLSFINLGVALIFKVHFDNHVHRRHILFVKNPK
jgi:hypothetical protein